MTELRVLVVSLDRLSRADLASVLDQQPDPTVVGQVSGDEESFLPADIYDPNVIVWDVSWETASATRNLGLVSENSPAVLALALAPPWTRPARPGKPAPKRSWVETPPQKRWPRPCSL